MKIGVVGSAGIVGGAYFEAFSRLGHEVFGHDIRLNTKIENLLDTEIIFICVPTPQGENGKCRTDIVESVIGELDSINYNGIIAIKSTVEPGTTQRLREQYVNRKIIFTPEFLRERSSFFDASEGMDICVIGCYSDDDFEKAKAAHGKYPKQVFKMTPTEAELCKYFNNVFCAMKVTFANGFYDVCQRLGADYSTIKNAIVKRPPFVDMYLDCNENLRGYAGMCYTKDVPAFVRFTDDLGIQAKIFSVIHEDNKLYKKTVFNGMRLE